MTFLDTLRALDAQATPGPFHLSRIEWAGTREPYGDAGDDLLVVTVYSKEGAPSGYNPVASFTGHRKDEFDVAKADATLYATLRNSTARLAAVVEAAGSVVASWYGNPGDSPSPDEAHAALRAAIAALDEVKS